jgi:hypothetical protein
VGRISGDTGESQTGEQGIKRSHGHDRMEDEGGCFVNGGSIIPEPGFAGEAGVSDGDYILTDP